MGARQASLSITNSQSSLKLTSIDLVMPSSHLILCRPLFLLPPIPPSIRVFSNESNLRMRWPGKSQIVYCTWMSCVVYELYLNKTVFKNIKPSEKKKKKTPQRLVRLETWASHPSHFLAPRVSQDQRGNGWGWGVSGLHLDLEIMS